MLAHSPTTPATSLESSLALAAERRTLLIVDDEEGPRKSLQMVFKDDYNVLLAENGLRALEHVKEHVVDAAIVDIRMPGMSGIEVLRQMKAIEPSVEVIILTAYETLETVRQALRYGACDYMNKPFDLETMRTVVASAMERRSLSEQIKANNNKLRNLQDEIHRQQVQEEMSRTKGEIYASIIHDINSPLTIISGLIELIDDRIAGAASLHGRDLEVVKSQITQITRQVASCIDISRRYLGLLRVKPDVPASLEVNQVLSDLHDLLKAHPSARNNELFFSPAPRPMQLAINGTDLIQILLNLAINALQCSKKPHRVRVTSEVLMEPLEVARLRSEAANWLVNLENFENRTPLVAIRVQDDGPGIPPEILSRIFEPYFTTKPNGEGTGLGLAIVQRLVRETHGILHLRSQPGKGSVFTFYIPARELPLQ